MTGPLAVDRISASALFRAVLTGTISNITASGAAKMQNVDFQGTNPSKNGKNFVPLLSRPFCKKPRKLLADK